jgi:hypothetical protein
MISVSTLNKYVREKNNIKQKTSICTGWYLHCDRTAQNNSVLSPKPVHVAIKQ